MSEFAGLSLKEAVLEIADADSAAGGAISAGIAALFASALVKRTISVLRKLSPSPLPEAEASQLEWEVDDSIAHFEKLLDKEIAAVSAYEKRGAETRADGLTADEIIRGAISVPSAIAAGSHRIARVASRLIKAAPSEHAADLGIALHLLYAAFIGGKIKMNDYFAHETSLDPLFIRKTRATLAQIEDEVSQFVGPGLAAMWDAIEPREINGES